MISVEDFKKTMEHAWASSAMVGHPLDAKEVMDLAVKLYEACLKEDQGNAAE